MIRYYFMQITSIRVQVCCDSKSATGESMTVCINLIDR